MNTVMWCKGFDAGYEHAVGQAFGAKPAPMPNFDTADEEVDYLDGYDAGYNSVDN